MRKAIYASSAEEGRALLARTPIVHLATTSPSGRPILRALHAVVDEDLVAFHGAPVGEKVEGLGRHAVVSAEEIVAEIPSWFTDPVRACPATTYFVSAQAEGRIEEVTEPARKARILAALMTKFQPEGRHAPLDHEDPLYRKAIDGLLVAGVRIDAIACKAKLGQNKGLDVRRQVVNGLWERGAPGDVAAVDLLVRRFPELLPASFVRDGYTLGCALAEGEVDEVLALLADAYWLADVPVATRRRAVLGSHVVTAKDRGGAIVAFARAVTDGRVAWIYDVIVRPDERGRGLGAWVFERLLDHPAVRTSHVVRLGTRDAMGLYARYGFMPTAEVRRAYPTTEMIRPARRAPGTAG